MTDQRLTNGLPIFEQVGWGQRLEVGLCLEVGMWLDGVQLDLCSLLEKVL